MRLLSALALCPALAAAAAGGAAPPSTPASLLPAPLSGPQVIQLLDQSIDWYRTLGIQQQAANQPSDLLILFDNRQTAGRVIALAFDIARADADILSQQPADQNDAPKDATTQSLLQLQAKFATQSSEAQSELDRSRQQLAAASGKQELDLKAKISELQGEIDLIGERKSLLTTMLTIANENDANSFSATSLKAEIEAMAFSIPSAVPQGAASLAPTAAGAAPAAGTSMSGTAAAGAFAPGSAAAAPAALFGAGISMAGRFGIWDLGANVLRLSEKISTIDGIDRRTASLQEAFAAVRNPLVQQLKALSARGDSLAVQADTADAATLNKTRQALDALAEQFKTASTLLVPLGKEGVLLAQYRRNLSNWRGIIATEYGKALKALGWRLALLGALLLLVFAAAELWRRAVLLYVHESRRRYQLLLLRRLSLWILVVLIVGFAFASELGSIVTFAGLLTAGLAVAMQSVLVSLVGYFFLIGKYGIRIGDKVQIGEVTGEVIQMGLVRMHLMELGGHGLLAPTGRVVAFANSIVFQVSSGLFRQIPGVNFAWHEVTLSLPAGIDYTTTKDKLLAAVTTALKDSRDEIVRQTREIQRTTASNSGGDSQPRVQLSFAAAGVEARIRYPVHLSSAAEIDERVSHELMNAVNALNAAGETHKGSP